MSQRKTIRFQCTTGPMIEIYIQELLAGGMHGDTRAEVVRRMMCNGIMAAIPGPRIQQLVARRQAEEAKKRAAP